MATALFDEGVYRPQREEVIPERSLGENFKDQALSVAQGAVDMATAPFVAMRDVGTPNDAEFGRQVEESGSSTKRWLGEQKSKFGQAAEEGKTTPGALQRTGETLLGSAPLGAAMWALGPAGPVLAGGVAHGAVSSELWDKLIHMPEEDLMKVPKYKELRDQGLSDTDALKQMYKDRNTAESLALNVGSNIIAGGVAQKLAGKAFGGSFAEAATKRIMSDAAFGGAEGAAAAALMGGGTEAGRQAAEQGAGLREGYDTGRITEQAVEGMTPLAIVGGALGAIKGIRTPTAGERAAKGLLPKVGKTAAEIADNTGYMPSADDIGTDILVAAADGLNRRPSEIGPRAAGDPVSGIKPSDTSTATPAPAPGVAAPTIGEQIQQRAQARQQARAADGAAPGAPPTPAVDPRTAAPAPVAPTPVPGAAAPLEPRVMPPKPLEPRVLAPGETAPRETPPMTVDDLKARASDLDATPDHGTLMKHINEWKQDNPGQKLSEQNAIIQENTRLRREAAQQLKDEAKAARQQKVDQAKADAAATGAQTAEVTQPSKPALAAPIEPVKPVEAAAPVEPVKPEVTVPIKPATLALSGAKAQAAIDRIRQTTEQRGQEALTKTVAPIAKAAEEEKPKLSNAQSKARRREDWKNQREQAAQQVFDEGRPGSNMQANLDALEDRVRKFVPDRRATDVPEIAGEMRELANESEAMSKAYDDKLKALTSTNGKSSSDVFARARGAGGKSRAGHGDYHSLMSDMHNFSSKMKAALDAGDHLEAKNLLLQHLEDIKAARAGHLDAVREAAKARSEAIGSAAKTNKPSEAQVEVAQTERARKVSPHEASSVPADEQIESEVERSLEEKPVTPLSRAEAKAKGLGVMRRDKLGRIRFDDALYPDKTLTREQHYVGGKAAPKDAQKVADLTFELDRAAHDLGDVDKLSEKEASKVMQEAGEKVKTGKIGDVLHKYRPDDSQPYLQKIYDAVYDVVKNMPVEVWSRDMMEAYAQHRTPNRPGAPLGLYSAGTGRLILRQDTLTAPVIFHEAIHAATSRAIRGSERLQALVGKLQDIIEKRYKSDIDVTSEMPFQSLIRDARGQRVNAREFVSELFSRPEIADLVSNVKLTPAEARALKTLGYRADIGKSIMRTLWDGFLKSIGFKDKNPNAFKVATDMLQDMFEREMKIRETDAAIGRPTGTGFNDADFRNMAAEDPVGGPGIVKAFQAGDYPTAINGLMNSAHLFSEGTLDKSVSFLRDYNKNNYGHEDFMADPHTGLTPLSNSDEVRSGVSKFLGDRFGETGKNLAFQIEKRFGTQIRKFTAGMRYTNDLGNNLEIPFKNSLRYLKEAMSKKEHFAQQYMDVSGANKLIDDMATLKNAIKDRGLWSDFENLLIRESYSRAYADEEIGSGRNQHIDTGDIRNAQTVIDHPQNQRLFRSIADRDPGNRLRDMRNRIHEFEQKDLELRRRAQASNMLRRMRLVDDSDNVGLRALVKDVMQDNSSMTDAERRAFDRIAGTDHEGKQFTDYVADRQVIRNMLDKTDKNGPHVPFMRHGNHAIVAKYFVRPDAGVDFREIDPDPKDGLHRGYDFKNEADAKDFVKRVLSRDDVQITQTGGSQIVYDKRMPGGRATEYTLEHRDGTATTFDNKEAMEAARKEGDKMKSRFVTPDDVERMKENNQPTGHYETYHRIEFNPEEYTRFDNERLANEYRDRIDHDNDDPNFRIRVSHVETPNDRVSAGNAPYASAEMNRWVNSVEASPAYQKLTTDQKADWKRELNQEAARVTMMTGRRSMFLPREYVKGASTDILKNMIQSAGASARAISGDIFNPSIAKGREIAGDYVKKYSYQSGFNAKRLEGETDAAYKARRDEGNVAKGHRARQEVLQEFDRRINAPVRVDGNWAQGIKRALQVSMISHLADVSYLVINAMEPWVFGAAMTASRHGWYGAYAELAKATALMNPGKLAAEAGREIAAGFRGKYRRGNYERMLLDAVRGEADGEGAAKMYNRLFQRGLISRDSGMEVERLHDPSQNVVFRTLDGVDRVFRAANTSVETLNRGAISLANYRLEFRKAIKEGKSQVEAQELAERYAEDMVFKGAGDYGSWNNPRYFANPFMKLAGQFKKYPLRIASVYGDAIIQSFKGNHEAQKQLAYMIALQGIASGMNGLTTGPFAGTVNAAYLLGLTDNKWSDVTFAARKWLVDRIGLTPTDAVMNGLLNFSGADFQSRLAQNSLFFFGDPKDRKPGDIVSALGKTFLGAPGDAGGKFLGGIQHGFEAMGHFNAGANSQGWASALQATDGILPLKILHDWTKTFQLASAGPTGMPAGNEGRTGQVIWQALGFTPSEVAAKQQAKATITRQQKLESDRRSVWVNRWLNAPNSAEQSAVWDHIQKQYNSGFDDPRMRINMGDLWKARNRKQQGLRQDDSKLGVRMSGRAKHFGDIHSYFSTGN